MIYNSDLTLNTIIAESLNVPKDCVYLTQDLLDEINRMISDWASLNKNEIMVSRDAMGEDIVCYVIDKIDRFIDSHSKEKGEDWGKDYGVVVRRVNRADCFMSLKSLDEMFSKYPEWQLHVYIAGRNRWHSVSPSEIGRRNVQEIMFDMKVILPGHDTFVCYDPLNNTVITEKECRERVYKNDSQQQRDNKCRFTWDSCECSYAFNYGGQTCKTHLGRQAQEKDSGSARPR